MMMLGRIGVSGRSLYRIWMTKRKRCRVCSVREVKMAAHIDSVSRFFHCKPAIETASGPTLAPSVGVVSKAVIAALGYVLIPAIAAAQLNAGRIVGTVTDPSRAAVPQVAVIVTDTATGLSSTVTTNDRGDYVVTPLNPGVYRLTVKLDGFQTAVVEALEVQVGQ